jgi:preprotein translocase subunit SecA
MGERIGMDIANLIWDRVTTFIERDDYDGCKEDFLKVLFMECPFTELEFNTVKKDDLIERSYQKAIESFNFKMQRIRERAYPVIKRVYEDQLKRIEEDLGGPIYERIIVPITDGKQPQPYSIPCNLKEAYETECKSVVKQFEKVISLHIIDDCWKENLRQLDELEHSVRNASYEQKDPLQIFKSESVKLWDDMIDDMNNRIASILTRGQIAIREEVEEAAPEQHSQRYNESKEGSDLTDENQKAAAAQDTRESARQQVRQPMIKDKLPGRNDPCPCGSGKKFKNCHGRGL